MADTIIDGFGEISQETQMLMHDKQGGFDYRQRRDQEFTETYELYRGKPTLNRLTQRQSVHIPLMKQQIRTMLKDVDDMPVLYFENLDNDKEAELFKNKYWEYTVDQNHMELQDIIDKRQDFLYGRTFDQWNIRDGRITMNVEDTMDFFVPQFNNPYDLNDNRFVIHTHVFRTFAQLEANADYDQVEIARLKKWYGTAMGLVKMAENQQSMISKNQRMQNLGVIGLDNPILGETWVELSLHFRMHKEPGETYEQFYLYVEAENMITLMKKPLDQVIGKTKDDYWKSHIPYNSWADDVDRTDFWSDGIGDVLRPLNKILNVWFSQLVENRTLRSLGMTWYDSTTEGFTPQTYQPQGFGFYGLPGKPADIVQPVNVGDLTDSLEEMNYLVALAEKEGASPTQQGAQTQTQITLGEVQLALGEAKQKIKSISKFYTQAWENRGEIFVKLLEAAPDKIDAVKIYAKGKNSNNIYSREVGPDNWEAESGYRCKVWSQEDRDNQNTQGLQKWNAVKLNMPDNPKVDEIYKRKLTEFAGATPDETNAIMKFEEDKQKAQMAMAATAGIAGGNPAAGPVDPKAAQQQQQQQVQAAQQTEQQLAPVAATN